MDLQALRHAHLCSKILAHSVSWPSSELRILFAQPELMPASLQCWKGMHFSESLVCNLAVQCCCVYLGMVQYPCLLGKYSELKVSLYVIYSF